MSTASDTLSAGGNDKSSSDVSTSRPLVPYAIPYVEIRNTSILVPRHAARRTSGKRVILPCYAAMESDFLANCLQGLSGLPGCESALLGRAWRPTSDRDDALDPNTSAEEGTVVQTALIAADADRRGGPAYATSDDAQHPRTAPAGPAVTDLARKDFFRPPPALSTATPSCVLNQSGASQPPHAEAVATVGRQNPSISATPSTGSSSSLVPRPPSTPPTSAATGRTPLGFRPLETSSSGTAAGVEGHGANAVATAAPVVLRGGIRSHWESASAPTQASLLYKSFVRQNKLDSHAVNDVEQQLSELTNGEGLRLGASLVTAKAMDDAEESEARNGQTNILTTMFMPVSVPSAGTRAGHATGVTSSAARACEGESCDALSIKLDGEDGAVTTSYSGENTPELEARAGLDHVADVTRVCGKGGSRRGEACAFECFASNAVPRMPSYEFPQLSDHVLVDVADFMVRRSTADRNQCTTSTQLSLCQSLGDPSAFRSGVTDPAEREATYKRGLELMMAASFLLL